MLSWPQFVLHINFHSMSIDMRLTIEQIKQEYAVPATYGDMMVKRGWLGNPSNSTDYEVIVSEYWHKLLCLRAAWDKINLRDLTDEQAQLLSDELYDIDRIKQLKEEIHVKVGELEALVNKWELSEELECFNFPATYYASTKSWSTE